MQHKKYVVHNRIRIYQYALLSIVFEWVSHTKTYLSIYLVRRLFLVCFVQIAGGKLDCVITSK